MNEKRDILDDSTLKGNPFRMPEGYFDGFEDRVMARIAAENQPAPSRRDRVWTVLKPALLLAAMFALVFGMGYGVLSFTHTLNSGASAAGVSDYASVEEEMITPASLLNYYQSDSGEEMELDEETIINYLASELSFSDLAEIYAQAY
jgi:hypothetical protein